MKMRRLFSALVIESGLTTFEICEEEVVYNIKTHLGFSLEKFKSKLLATDHEEAEHFISCRDYGQLVFADCECG